MSDPVSVAYSNCSILFVIPPGCEPPIMCACCGLAAPEARFTAVDSADGIFV